MQYDVIIIGSGLAGLAAGAKLAAFKILKKEKS